MTLGWVKESVNPSESEPLPNPSESGIHFCRVKMPIQIVQYAKESPEGLLRIHSNPPESDPLPNASESGNALPAVTSLVVVPPRCLR